MLRSLLSKNASCQWRSTVRKHSSSKALIQKEIQFSPRIYESIPCVITRGKGSTVWDVDGKEYLDFLGGFAVLNTGHCHPKMIETLVAQASSLHHTSRAFFNSELPLFCEFATSYFSYDKVLPMNTGVEGCDTAVKIARRWGYMKKGIPKNEAIVVFVTGNFWGRSMSAVSTSQTPVMFDNFGPFTPGFVVIPYDDTKALQEILTNKNVCAFMAEPIQGESGVIVPKDGYLTDVRKLCTENKVLWIADEIQTGLGRTGELLAVNHEVVKPDLLVLGKGLAGGIIPMSAVLGNDNVMDVMTAGTHGSTFGGNPLASRLAIRCLQIIREECLVENSRKLGQYFREELTKRLPVDVVEKVRGKGLMNAIVLHKDAGKAGDLVLIMKEKGLLTKPCSDKVIRFTPPLVVSNAEISRALDVICSSVEEFRNKK